MPSLQSALFGAVVALFVALAAVIVWQHIELKHAIAQYDQALSAQAVLQADNANFKQLADGQNLALAKLKAAQAARSALAARALASANQNVRRYTALASAIEKQKPSGDDCQNAQIILRVYLAGRK